MSEKPQRRTRQRPTPPAGDAAARRRLTVDESVFALYDRLVGDVHLPAVLRDVAEVVCQDLSAERATVYVLDEDTQELRSVAVVGNVAREIRIPISASSLAGYCALSGRAFVVGDAYGDLAAIHPDLRFDRSWDGLNGFRTRDVMCSPARFKGATLGVVQAVNGRGRTFCQEDLPPLGSLSRLIGYALHHARVYEDLATWKRLDQEKAQFLRIMVHELKSPVSASKMLADAMAGYGQMDDRSRSMAERISRRMEEMTQLIADMLDLARAKAGGPIGEVGVLDLAACAGEVCARYRDPAERKGLALRADLPDQPVPVRFDSRGLDLVVSNLVSNAVKYTASGSVRVAVVCGDGWASLTVADTGMGIPEKDLPGLFSEFFRASNARGSGIAGSGVGLALVKQMVERFGGELRLTTRQDVGSTFAVRLPLGAEA